MSWVIELANSWLPDPSNVWRTALPAGVGDFAQPLWFALGIPLLMVWLVLAFRRRPEALGWPALAEAQAAGAGSLDLVRWLCLALRTAAALALLACLAGPRGQERVVRPKHEGLDLVLAIDASGSMRALDAEVDGEWRTRLDLAKEVVSRFAMNRVAEGDRVGLVVFGDAAFTQCPLTRDGELLASALQRVEAGMAGEATALGDALTLAIKRVMGPALDATGTPLVVEGGAEPGRSIAPAAGRLVVLLTDGRSNAGAIPADVAAALAAHHRTRVHTVGIGGSGEVAMAHPSRKGTLRFERHDLDATTLQLIARSSSGHYFHARTSGQLDAVYREIDALERVPRTAPPRIAGAPLPEPFLAAALVLVLLELALGRVLWRRLP